MEINVDQMNTLPPLDTLPPKVRKLIRKVARRLVLSMCTGRTTAKPGSRFGWTLRLPTLSLPTLP